VSVPFDVHCVSHPAQAVLSEGGYLRKILAKEASLWGRLTGCFNTGERSGEVVASLKDSLARRFSTHTDLDEYLRLVSISN